MKVFKEIGSKERFVEIFQNVNKVRLNEAFGQTLNPQAVLAEAFEELKSGVLKVKHSNTQTKDDESYVELLCIDNEGNNINFTFKAFVEEGDQEGVFDVKEVMLEHFAFDSVADEESVEIGGDSLKQFNAQHQSEMFNIVDEYMDVEEEEPIDTLYEDAVKLIDKVPYKAGSERMVTHPQYADEKPTNPKLRVDAEELDKFVNEGQGMIRDAELAKMVDKAIENYYNTSHGQTKQDILNFAKSEAQNALVDMVRKAGEEGVFIPDVVINGIRQKIVDTIAKQLFTKNMIAMNEGEDYPEGMGKEFKPESQTDYAKKTKSEKKRKSKKVKIKEYYSVVDSEFNRQHFGEYIGQILDKPLPYAQVRVLKESVEVEDDSEEEPMEQIPTSMEGMPKQEPETNDGMSLEPNNDEVAQLTQDKEEMAMHAKEILNIAQQGEEENPEDVDDKEMTDALLGYKPMNVGEELNYDNGNDTIVSKEEADMLWKKLFTDESLTDEEANKLADYVKVHGTGHVNEAPVKHVVVFDGTSAYVDDESNVPKHEEIVATYDNIDDAQAHADELNNKAGGNNMNEDKESELKQKDPATWHQIQIAKKTLRMPDAMLGVMGGMTKEEAKEILRKHNVTKLQEMAAGNKTKMFKIGEYAIGGIIKVDIDNKSGVSGGEVAISALDWNTKQPVQGTRFVATNLRGIDNYLHELTSSYYAGKIMEWLKENLGVSSRPNYFSNQNW